MKARELIELMIGRDLANDVAVQVNVLLNGEVQDELFANVIEVKEGEGPNQRRKLVIVADLKCKLKASPVLEVELA
jgi:hypothetical protein